MRNQRKEDAENHRKPCGGHAEDLENGLLFRYDKFNQTLALSCLSFRQTENIRIAYSGLFL
jgi:hypothetical protein